MDWIAALCLSLPIAAAVFFAIVALGQRIIAAQALRDATWEANTALIRNALKFHAEAIVTAAKWASGAKKVKVKETVANPTPYQTWESGEGQHADERVRHMVEWALGKIMGTEPDDELGRGVEYAEQIVAKYAMGMGAYARLWKAKQRAED